MKKEITFRLIELPTHQILLTKDWDENNDDSPILVITVFISGVKATAKLGFDTVKKRNDAFKAMKIENAEEFLNAMLSAFTN